MTDKTERNAEGLARWAVMAAVAKDADELVAALDAIGSADTTAAEAGIGLYVAVARAALIAVHQGGVPSERQNRELADGVFKDESTWSPIRAEDVYQLLEGLSDDAASPEIPPERFPSTLFITLGHLLKWYGRGLGYKHYDDFLDALIADLLKKDDAQ